MHCAPWPGIVLALVLTAPAPVLRCQQAEPARVTQPGRVLDSERKPVADAAVLLVARAEYGGIAPGHVVRATSDASGRFRAALQPARRYVAWASAVRDGATFVSEQVDVGADGTELVLGAKPAPLHLTITGLDAWREAGPLRIQIDVHGCDELAIAAPLDATGRVTLPPLPRMTLPMRLLCGDALVHAADVGPGGAENLPPPRTLRVQARDADGAPIAGATVHRVVFQWSHHSGPFPSRAPAARHPIATTAADGTATALVASAKELLPASDYAMLLFVVTKEGYVDGLAGRAQKTFTGDRLLADAEVTAGVLPIVMRRGSAVSVRLATRPEESPKAVQWLGQHTVPYDKDSRTTMLDGGVLVPVDGRLHLPHQPVEGGETTLAIPVQIAPLAAEDPWSRLVRPTTLLLPRSLVTGRDTLDLREVQPLRLHVLDAAGGPAMHARLLVAPKTTNGFVEPSNGLQATTDRSGRALVPALPGTWIVAAIHGTGFAKTLIEVQPGLPVQTVRLEALPHMPVVVRDGQGAAVVDVSFSTNGASWSGGGSPEDEWVRNLAWSVTSWTLGQARSDANGRADLHFLPARGMEMRIEARLGRREARLPRLEAGDTPTEIILP